ncbi:MAG: PAS domain-containing protein [Thermoplasmata archaeon]|nr:MAG: PAS domain-containing protein [Thermoplasmata archaeon]
MKAINLNESHIRKKTIYLVAALAILLAIIPLMLTQPIQNFYMNLFKIIIPLLTLFLIARIHEYKADEYRDVAFFLGIAIFLIWIGEIVSMYYREIGEDTPFIVDLFYILAYFPIFRLVIKYVKPYIGRAEKRSLVTLLVALAAISTLIFYPLLHLMFSKNAGFYDIFLVGIYAMLDVGMLFALAFLLLIYYHKETSPFWLAISFSVFFGVAGDISYFYLNQYGIGEGGVLVEVIFNLMYASLLIALCLLASEKLRLIPLSKFEKTVGKLKEKIEETEEQIRMEREQLLSIFEGIDEPIYVVDPETYEILYANKALKKLFGEDIISKKCYKTFQNLDEPCDFCTNDKILGKNFGKTYVWEWQNLVNKRWYRCIDRGIKWPDGREVRYEIAIDITERKQAEEKMKRALEQEREFKLRTAHYFFNPIVIAKGYIDVMMDEVGEEEKEKLKTIRRAIERIERVVKNVISKGEIHE